MYHDVDNFVQFTRQIRFYAYVIQSFRRNHSVLKWNEPEECLSCKGSLLVLFGFPIDVFFDGSILNSPFNTVWWHYPFTKGKTCRFSFYNIHWRQTLQSFGHTCVQLNTDFINFLCFSCHRISRDIVCQHRSWFPGYYSLGTGFLEFNSLRTQPFHAWLNTKFIT